MFLNDLDPQFIKSLNYLYASDNLVKGDAMPLQFSLEEAIKNKSGVMKDLTSVVSASFKQRRVTEFKPFASTLEESNGSSSDKELELDLLKEDLMCIICNGMDTGARNRLLECSDCHMLYHQECHKPIVTNQESFDTWVCQNCKEASKKLKVTATSTAPTSHGKTSSSSSSSSSSSTSSSKSSSHRHSSSYKSETKGEKYAKSSSSSSKTSKPSSSSTSRSNVTPNINIISADKRIQIMKKKAAKLQEKRMTRLNR